MDHCPLSSMELKRRTAEGPSSAFCTSLFGARSPAARQARPFEGGSPGARCLRGAEKVRLDPECLARAGPRPPDLPPRDRPPTATGTVRSCSQVDRRLAVQAGDALRGVARVGLEIGAAPRVISSPFSRRRAAERVRTVPPPPPPCSAHV